MADTDVRVIEGEDREFIEAEFVTVRQSTVKSVEGGRVELQQVAALSIDGERVEMTQSASAITHGGETRLNQSMSVITVGNDVQFHYSCAPLALTRDNAAVSGSAVGILGARTIKAENTSAIMMLANTVEGEVTTLLDWRSALALGAVVGGAFGLISLLRKK
jgi:hypothetical protein